MWENGDKVSVFSVLLLAEIAHEAASVGSVSWVHSQGPLTEHYQMFYVSPALNSQSLRVRENNLNILPGPTQRTRITSSYI